MAIRLPPSQTPPASPAVTPLAQGRSPQAMPPLNLLTVPEGTQLQGRVDQVSLVTSGDRETLLGRTLQEMVKAGHQDTTVAAKPRFNQLLEQQQLLNTPLLQLVRLIINNRHSLVVYTDKPIQAGQTLTLQVGPEQRLQLLSLPASPPLSATSASTPTPAALPNPVDTHNRLADALRQWLPRKDNPDLLQVISSIRQLPPAVRIQALTPTVDQALSQWLNTLPTPATLSQTEGVRQALINSGVFLEQKLTGLQTNTSQPVGSGQAATLSNTAGDRPLAATDIKGALQHLLSRVEQAVPLPPAAIDKSVVSAGLSLLQLLYSLPSRPRAELSERVLRTQLMLLLHQHTLASLTKIQLQQLHTVSHQQSQTDTPQPTQSWTFELPIRLGQEARTLEFRIDEEWQDESQAESDTTRTRCWRVQLAFDLAELGALHAQLRVVHERVSAHFWAEQEQTLVLAQQQLTQLRERLEKQGLTLTQLQCHPGKPPERGVSLNYSLVDIKT